MNTAKAILGSAVMILIFSAPAHGQMSSSSSVSMSQGAGGGAGSLSAPSAISELPHTAPANLSASIVSGSDADYLPSNFVAFDNAVAEGQVHIVLAQRTVAQAAAESRQAPRIQAKAVITQDNQGRILVTKP